MSNVNQQQELQQGASEGMQQNLVDSVATRVTSQVTSQVIQHLDQRLQAMETRLMQHIDKKMKTPYQQQLAGVNQQPKGAAAQQPQFVDPAAMPQINGHLWADGTIHRIPENFSFPARLNPLGAFQLWNLGDKTNRIPPLCTLQGSDFQGLSHPSCKRGQKKFSDLKGFNKILETKMKAAGCWKAVWTEESTRLAWEVIRDEFEVDEGLRRNSLKRKKHELSWETIFKEVRTKNAPRKKARNVVHISDEGEGQSTNKKEQEPAPAKAKAV